MNKKIAIIGTVGIPAKYGGFETLAEYLTVNLSNKYDFTVYCSAKNYDEKLISHNGAKLKYINLNANGVQSIPYDIVSIFSSLKFADTLLILGVSGCIVLPFVRLFSKKKIIVNIDGLEWKRDKWGSGVKWFLKYSEKLAVKYSDVVVTDNIVIQEYVIQEYVKKEYDVDIALIAYGADHVTKEALSNEVLAKFSFWGEPYAFTVCRIEPENNIHVMLEAFKEYEDLNIVIIGNWSNSEYGRNLQSEYVAIENIYLLDPIYEQQVLNQIRSNCYVYMHGHSAGGTNPSLVEAMYLELPIVAFGVDYNRETTKGKAVYFNNKDDLVKVLDRVKNEELKAIGKKMKKIAQENYTWDKISRVYSKLF